MSDKSPGKQTAPAEEKSTIRELISSRSAQYGDKIFLLDPEKEKEYSYARFAEKVDAVSNFLHRQGIGKDDKVALFMPNSPAYLFFFFGIMQLGAVACPINTHLQAEELAYILHNSDSAALFCAGTYLENALPAIRSAAEQGELRFLFCEDTSAARLAELQEQLSQEQLSPLQVVNVEEMLQEATGTLLPEIAELPLGGDDVAEIIYTSGTTGRPKGAMLTHHNLLIDASWIARWNRLGEDDRALCVMPLFHINAQIVTVLTPLYHGGSVVLPERFSVTRFFPLINYYGATYVGTVATMLSMLLNKAGPREAAESKLKIVFCGSAPVPAEVLEKFEKTFQVPVIEGYGMTETSCRSTFNPLPPPDALKLGENDGYRKIGSVGLPLGNEMLVLDDHDNPLGPGEIGEIVIRGPNVTKGYYKDRASTEKVMRGGWFYSGDLGYYDEDGYFYIVDRKNDMIIRGGENIYPREIEEVLYTHPAVRDAACIGIPDQLYGEEVAAFVVLKDTARAAEEELVSFCRERLAAYKCPKKVTIVEEIPKSSSGKLLRKELRKRT